MKSMKTVQEKDKVKGNNLFYYILISTFAVAVVLLFGYFGRLSYAELLRRGVTVLFSMILFCVIYSLRRNSGSFFFTNDTKDKRALLLFLIWIPVAAGMSVLPLTGWLYPLIFVLIALSSESITGIAGGLNLLTITVLMSEAPLGVFAFYLLISVFAVLVFTDFDRAYSGNATLLGFLLFYFFLQGCLMMFYVTGVFRPEAVLMPVANVLLHMVFLLIIIRQVNLRHLEVRASNYAGLGDQTAELLEKLKDDDPDRYYLAIHAAHFCMRLAKEIKADPMLCRIGAYYAWMPEVYEETDEREQLYEENAFPSELCDLIEEIRIKPFSSTEAFLIALSYELAQALTDCREEGKDMTKAYPGIVERLLKQHYLSDDLSLLELSFAAYAVIEKTLANEKKYLVMMEGEHHAAVRGV